MDLDLKLVGFDEFKRRNKNYLIVCNHMSYLDVMLMASVMPCVFVTSVDMGETKFLGTMAEMGGAIFIERRNRERVDADRSTMANALRKGHNVVIYPEGTSTNGSGVLPFKKSLLTAAVEGGVDIQPVVLRYTEINGEPFSEKNRDVVCWYGDMPFVSHLTRVLSLKSWKAELRFLSPIAVHPNSTRDELAEKSHRLIAQTYIKPDFAAGRPADFSDLTA